VIHKGAQVNRIHFDLFEGVFFADILRGDPDSILRARRFPFPRSIPICLIKCHSDSMQQFFMPMKVNR
jgi:hypothetical protein